jgi:Glyoxalase-like domain
VTDRPHQLLSLTVGDDPDAWRTAGFAVDAGGRLRLGSTVIALTGTGGGVAGWSIEDVDGPIDGLPAAPVVTGAADAPGAHPNGIDRIDHVVVRTGDCDRTIAAFEAAGLEVRGGRSTTSYGTPMRQTFLWAGDVIIELVGPDAGEPTTDEVTSFFGLALVAEDLDATAAHLGDLMGTPKEAVQDGRRIAGLRGKDAGISVPLAVMSPHPGRD